MGFDGYILLAILTLFFVYFLPSVVRSAQIVAEARIEDRFSSDLQIVATAGQRQERNPSQGRTYIHPPRTSEQLMNTPVAQPYAAGDQRRIATAQAARIAASNRRAAAAKRRLLLLSALGALTLSAWVLTAMTAFSWVIAAVVTTATVATVELGRRAAVAGQRADAVLAQRVREAEAIAKANVTPKQEEPAPEPKPESAPVEAEPASSLRVATDPELSTWTPVPVPPPAYTLKAEVRRKLVEPYEEPAAQPAAEKATPSVPAQPAAQAEPTQPEPAQPEQEHLNVQEILARRRAVG